MSYHEISVQSRYRLTCEICNFISLEETAGSAEEKAKDHINEEYGGSSNYDHVLTVQTLTVVGRQI